jgi:hypothetical protein
MNPTTAFETTNRKPLLGEGAASSASRAFASRTAQQDARFPPKKRKVVLKHTFQPCVGKAPLTVLVRQVASAWSPVRPRRSPTTTGGPDARWLSPPPRTGSPFYTQRYGEKALDCYQKGPQMQGWMAACMAPSPSSTAGDVQGPAAEESLADMETATRPDTKSCLGSRQGVVTPSPTPASGGNVSLLPPSLRPRGVLSRPLQCCKPAPTTGLAPTLPDALEEKNDAGMGRLTLSSDALRENNVPYDPPAIEYIVIDSSDDEDDEEENANKTNTSGGTQPSFSSDNAVGGSSCQSSLYTDSRASVPRRLSMPTSGIHGMGGTISVGEPQPMARHLSSPTLEQPPFLNMTSWPSPLRWNSLTGFQRQQQRRYPSPAPAMSSPPNYYMTPAPVETLHPLYFTSHSGRRAAAFSPQQQHK